MIFLEAGGPYRAEAAPSKMCAIDKLHVEKTEDEGTADAGNMNQTANQNSKQCPCVRQIVFLDLTIQTESFL
jgi:hypothetical protein